MKDLFVFFIILYSVQSDKQNYKFFPNLPAGEYHIKFNAISNCNTDAATNKINYNCYLNKKSANSTEVKGNTTLMIPLDDSLDFNVKMAIKDSIGGWKDNAFSYKSDKSCTTLKNFMGNVWGPLLGSLGIKNTTCPIAPGFYSLKKGFDTSNVEKFNIPKTFFYGTYKFRFHHSKNNQNYGCVLAIIEIKRPWESF